MGIFGKKQKDIPAAAPIDSSLEIPMGFPSQQIAPPPTQAPFQPMQVEPQVQEPGVEQIQPQIPPAPQEQEEKPLTEEDVKKYLLDIYTQINKIKHHLRLEVFE